MPGDLADAVSVLDPGEDEGAIAAHLCAVALHDREVGSDRFGQVGLVDDQEVGLGDSRAALARDLVASGDVDHVDRIVGEFPAEMGGEVVAAGFAEEQVGLDLCRELLERQQVGRNIFPDRGMRAASCLNGLDALSLEGPVTNQEFSVLAGEDVVGYRGQAQTLAQFAAERQQQGGLAAADRAADSDREGAPVVIPPGRGQLAFFEQARMLHVLVGVPVPGVVMGVRMIMPVAMLVGVVVRV